MRRRCLVLIVLLGVLTVAVPVDAAPLVVDVGSSPTGVPKHLLLPLRREWASAVSEPAGRDA
jgi:hypothetical protein